MTVFPFLTHDCKANVEPYLVLSSINISVQVQFLSKKAPPAVWILATSYHKPEYLAIVKCEAGGGLGH